MKVFVKVWARNIEKHGYKYRLNQSKRFRNDPHTYVDIFFFTNVAFWPFIHTQTIFLGQESWSFWKTPSRVKIFRKPNRKLVFFGLVVFVWPHLFMQSYLLKQINGRHNQNSATCLPLQRGKQVSDGVFLCFLGFIFQFNTQKEPNAIVSPHTWLTTAPRHWRCAITPANLPFLLVFTLLISQRDLTLLCRHLSIRPCTWHHMTARKRLHVDEIIS